MSRLNGGEMNIINIKKVLPRALGVNMKVLTKIFGPPKRARQIICKDPKEVAQCTTLAPPRANIAPGGQKESARGVIL